MKAMPCYAHSREGAALESWQLLDEHLAGTAQRASTFGEPFGSAAWAANAAWLHDMGKASPAFQAYLLRENHLDASEYDEVAAGRVNHSSAGAAYAELEITGPVGRTLAYLAAGHHAGLPDWDVVGTGRAALQCRLEEGRINLTAIPEFSTAVGARLSKLTRPPAFVTSDSYHLWVRMLFSCLVDADYLDTEAFLDPRRTTQRRRFASLSELKRRFDDRMAKLALECEASQVNAIRRDVLASCRQAAASSPGLFSLTVPTGGGKTLSAMAFALDHALRHGKSRVIYVIPYTSIIEQTASTLQRIFGGTNVVEHHCNLDPKRETVRGRLAAENWDAPIVVTTNVQFFESLFAASPGRCRKLHNIANSVVILDEAQLLPPNLLTPCVAAVSHLVACYGATIVLSTATQPKLPGLGATTEIIPAPASLYEKLRRVTVNFPSNLRAPVTWEGLASDLAAHKSVLCIVNTRRDCYDLWQLMPRDAVHLSASMCGAHRSSVIERIRTRLKAHKPVQVISTQLVEAGVDIDFPIVYRALAGLDSIAQAAGRCNREGRHPANMSQVHVFVPPKPAPIGLLRKGEDATRTLVGPQGVDPLCPSTFARYFDLFYANVNNTGTRFRDLLVRDAPAGQVQFRTAGDEFRLIDDQAQRPVVVRYGAGKELIRDVQSQGPDRLLMRRLQRYVVNLPARMVEIMLDDGRLEPLDERHLPGIACQSLLRYDERCGLDVFGEGIRPEELMA